MSSHIRYFKCSQLGAFGESGELLPMLPPHKLVRYTKCNILNHSFLGSTGACETLGSAPSDSVSVYRLRVGKAGFPLWFSYWRLSACIEYFRPLPSGCGLEG